MKRTAYIGLAVAIVAIIAAALLMLREQSDGQEGAAPVIDTVGAMERRGEPADAAAVEDEPAPAFTLPTLSGDSLSMADLRGKVVVVNFWATWCAPCRIEIPDLIELQDELRDDGVQFVGITMEYDAVDAVRAYAAETEFNYPIAIDTGDVADDFGGIYALPTTVLINREGVIVRKIPGFVTRNFLLPLLQELAES